jgi:hypothetical protein
MTRLERLIVKLDEHPWHAIFRVAIGLAITPAWLFLFGGTSPGSTLVLWFVGVLLALRVTPMLIRRSVPFSADARSVWAARREIGRKYDSYQWQKLFWIGLGLAGYSLLARERRSTVLVLTALCLISGVGGLSAWSRRSVLSK